MIDTSPAANWDTQDGCEVYLALESGEGLENVRVAQFAMYGNAARAYAAGRVEDMEVAVRREAPGLSAEVVEALKKYAFPGNVDELKNVVERALIESGGRELRPEHVQF